MIAATPEARHPPDWRPQDWQQQLADAVVSAEELCAILGLDPEMAGVAHSDFPLRVPRSFVRRMRHGDYRDPLLRQVLPIGAELAPATGYSADPLNEAAAQRGGGLLQKYANRALLIATAACAVHCRYCFRREYPYAGNAGDGARWQQALASIAGDPSIEEVIISGGDPLSLRDSRLEQLTTQIARIPHIVRFRIHTRAPIVLPARVDGGLCQWLQSLPWRPVIVLHANHANEIDAEVIAACQALRAAGATLLNQSVLLAGVNDSGATLCELSRSLWSAGVLPYYLHLLDRVRGASHFEVTQFRAHELHLQLLAELPGYLVPRLVREQPGAASKTPIHSA